MKISVQGSGYFDWKDPDSSFKFISECGFDAVDFNIDNLLSVPGITKAESISSFFDKSDEEIIEFFRPIKEAAEKYGISFVQMHAPFPVWVKDRPDVTEYVRMANEKCFMVCNYVGCPAIVVHPVGRTTKEEEIETNLITLVDDEGNEHEFEFLDSIEMENGGRYVALVPTFSDPEAALQDSAELVILEVVEENGEEFLDPIQDEETFNEVSAVFVERLSEEYDIED